VTSRLLSLPSASSSAEKLGFVCMLLKSFRMLGKVEWQEPNIMSMSSLQNSPTKLFNFSHKCPILVFAETKLRRILDILYV
jgi:hypothetical protein